MPFYSPSTRGFYVEAVHGRDIPADAVKITNRRHQELLLAQAQGHEIVPTSAGPEVHHAESGPEVLLARAVSRVKREARRRILAIASLEQQSNDNAALALAVLAGDSTASLPALERRQKIDAVRAASNAIEAGLADLKVTQLATFNAASAAWPN